MRGSKEERNDLWRKGNEVQKAKWGKGDLKGGEWKGDVNIYGLKL